MARGSGIIVAAQPAGKFTEGRINAGITPKPGTIMQIDPTQALVGGRHVYKLYDRVADGDRPAGGWWVLLEDYWQGKAATAAYAAGDRCRLYAPVNGEEINLLVANFAGTADDHTAGEVLMPDDGTGLLIAFTGTPQTEIAILLEDVTDPTADTLAWCQWSGH